MSEKDQEKQQTVFKTTKSFVIRGGRLSNLQQKAIQNLSDAYMIPYEPLKPFHSAEVFMREAPTIIEIGFGMGTSTALIAQKFPENNYIGIEVHRPGIGKLLSEIERLGLKNIRIIQHDAVEVIKNMISQGSIDGFHIFFPDPWPKKKHHKRRLIQPEFVSLICSALKQSGYLYAVTDWDPYAEQMLEVFQAESMLKNTFTDYAPSKDWRPLTKFEQKGLSQNHVIHELWFEKV